MKKQTPCYKPPVVQIRISSKQLFQPNHLIANLTAGIICGEIIVIYSISFAALIFSGDLSAHISTGVGLALFTAITVSIVTAFMSSLPGVVIMPQDSTAVLLGLMASAIVTQMPASATSTDILYTVITAISLTSILAGIFCFVLGTFKLGELTRLIPYPVVGGFLAGTGWLLSYGALNLMADIPLTLAHLPQLFQPEILLRWFPGACFALLLLVLLRRYHHSLILPGIVLGAIGLFYLLLLVSHTSIAEARDYGLLFHAFPETGMWQPLQPTMLFQANWQLIFKQMGQVFTILLLTAIALLLNCTGIELATGQEIEPNRELQTIGIANLIAGLGGGIIGFHCLGLSTLNLAKIGA
ncbi:MAG TPA: SulP family inorganic anion transporter, partial [Allocoleopsis sp.]